MVWMVHHGVGFMPAMQGEIGMTSTAFPFVTHIWNEMKF